MGNDAQQVLLSRDPEKAARLREEDDAMDNLHRQLFTPTARNRAREE